MMMADRQGAFLYQIRPDLFPQGFFTWDELQLWELYFEDLNTRRAAEGQG